MQAIQTKYLGPTNSRGSRIVAFCEARRIIVPYTYEAAGVEVEHTLAAFRLAQMLGWTGHYVGGSLPDGKGYAFVNVGASKPRRAHVAFSVKAVKP